MTPGLAIYDKMYGQVPQRKTAGDGGLAFSVGSSRSYLRYNLGCKFFGVSMLADGMVDIPPMGSPFKVVGSVIRFIQVHVVHIGKPYWVWVVNERLGNKSANICHLLLSVLAKSKMPVTAVVRRARKNFPLLKGRVIGTPFVMDQSVYTANAAKIGGFVKAFVAHNCLPLLTRHRNAPYIRFPMNVARQGA